MVRKYGGPNGYGHRPDPGEHQVTSFGLLRARFRAALPPSFSVTDKAPAVMDQGQTSSCVGHATSGAITTSCAWAGTPLAFHPSPAGIYEVARCIDRVPALDGSLASLTDEGSMPNQAMRGLEEWGIRPMNAPTPDGRNSDVRPETVNDEPTLGDLEQDSALELVGAYRIATVGAVRVQDLCHAVVSGFAVCFATFVDTAFESWSPASGPMGAPDTTDPNGGSHYLYMVGYRTDPKTGKKVVRFRNSWGPEWGIGGDGEGNEDFIAGLSDIYVMAVKPKDNT